MVVHGKIIIILFIIALLMLLLLGCQPQNSSPEELSDSEKDVIVNIDYSEIFRKPDRIIYYFYGKEIDIELDSESFDTIYQYIINRFPKDQDIDKAKLDYEDDLMEKLQQEGVCLVFEYDKSITFIVNGQKYVAKTFYFPLTGEYFRMFFGCGAWGPLSHAKELREYLEEQYNNE